VVKITDVNLYKMSLAYLSVQIDKGIVFYR